MSTRTLRLRPEGATATAPADRVLVDVLAAVAAHVRAGGSLATAWAAAGLRSAGGVPDEDDLRALAGAAPEHARAVVAVCRLSVTSGAPPAGVLDHVLSGVVGDVRAADARRAALAAPRATGRLLSWLPVVGLVLGAALGADPVAVLLGGGAGTVGLLVGVVLAAAGRRWSGALVARAEAAGRES